MSKFAICDNCGEKDDTTYSKIPILYAGALIQLREADGDGIGCELEICESCRNAILKAFPNLAKSVKEQT